jgi:hypothetical protein
MSDEYVLIDCPNGHQFMGRKAKTEVEGLISQQLVCPTCGRRWESIIPYAIDLTGREV